MGLIVKKLCLMGDKGRQEAEVLFDSGARRSVIRRDVAEKLSTLINAPAPAHAPLKFRLADGKTELTTFTVADICGISKGFSLEPDFYTTGKVSGWCRVVPFIISKR